MTLYGEWCCLRARIRRFFFGSEMGLGEYFGVERKERGGGGEERCLCYV